VYVKPEDAAPSSAQVETMREYRGHVVSWTVKTGEYEDEGRDLAGYAFHATTSAGWRVLVGRYGGVLDEQRVALDADQPVSHPRTADRVMRLYDQRGEVNVAVVLAMLVPALLVLVPILLGLCGLTHCAPTAGVSCATILGWSGFRSMASISVPPESWTDSDWCAGWAVPYPDLSDVSAEHGFSRASLLCEYATMHAPSSRAAYRVVDCWEASPSPDRAPTWGGIFSVDYRHPRYAALHSPR
jgi:hypothetical protein